MKSAETSSGPASTPVPCPLYKPLWELTEDDIAQVTREDCRRFLKEKGMRRPSWNKSQAIQQVISLKALLEPKPEAEEEEQHNHHHHQEDEEDDDEEGEEEEGAREERRVSSSSSSLPKPLAEQQSLPAGSLPPPAAPSPPAASRDVSSSPQFLPTYLVDCPEGPYRRRDPVAAAAPRPPQLFVPGDASTSFRIRMAAQREVLTARPEIAGVSPRVAAPHDPATAEATQMAIFYGGRVNVYDTVPDDRAVSIIRVAASQDCTWDHPSSHQQRQQIQQPFRLLQPRGTYSADNPAAAPSASIRQPHPLQSPSFTATGSANVNGNVRPHPRSQNRVPDNLDRINTNDTDDQPDCPTNRIASLQRYLEKRKDRKIFKCKKNVEGLPLSSVEVYMSPKFRGLVPNGLYHVDFYSSIHPKPPITPT